MVIDTMVFAYALLHVEDRYEQAIAVLERQKLCLRMTFANKAFCPKSKI
ncbi:hypothetical protein [Nostoc sp. ChiQUE01b]|nr:hypothetical protein [Nostoc sp. ChiQUE01b]